MANRVRKSMVAFPRWHRVEVTDGMAELATNRTEHLGATALQRPLSELLRDAYIQGANDMMDVAMTERGRAVLSPEST